MDKQMIAKELLKLAKELTGTNYPRGYIPSSRELQVFYKYVLDFYGRNGLYPLIRRSRPLSIFEVNDATKKLLKSKHVWGGGDTVDREAVRDILTDDMGFDSGD